MTINAMIPLAGQPVQLGRTVRQGAVSRGIIDTNRDFRGAQETRDRVRDATAEEAEATAERAKRVAQVEKAVMDVSEVAPMLGTGNVQGAIGALQRRAERIQAEGGDPSNTLADIERLSSGDPTQIQQVGDEYASVLAKGKILGILKPQTQTPPYTDIRQGDEGLIGIPRGGSSYQKIPGSESGARREKTGITIGPDGTVTIGGGAPLSTSTTNKVQASILGNDAALQHLAEIESGFRPEYLTIEGKYGARWDNLMDRFGQLDPKSKEARELQAYSEFRASAGEYFAKTLKEMSGGAVTDGEAKRQEVWLPDVDKDGPTQFKAKMDRSVKFIKSANARLHYALQNGLSEDQMYKIPLGSIPGLINARGAELESMGLSEDEVAAQLRQEFNL